MESGRFVLRIPPQLHKSLKREAHQLGVSLNQIVLRRLVGDQSSDPYRPIKKVFGNHLVGLVLFGSTVRGESRRGSDLDLLLVLDQSIPIERGLYRTWDEQLETEVDTRISPQFSHLPQNLKACSSLWLEVALEGEIVFDPSGSVRKTIYSLKSLIASGAKVRKISHGHPYWISNEVKADEQ